MPFDLSARLREDKLLAIVRGRNPDAALDAVLTLAAGGIRLLEVSLTAVDALRVIERARQELPDDVLIGAGTVISADDARRAADAGAVFAVTPGVTEAVATCGSLGLPVLAGAFTPTEVVAAVAAGATAIKLFPAGSGGVEHLRALRAPFPGVAFVPVGGVDVERCREYLDAGATAVGVGGPLLGSAADVPDRDGLTARISEFRAAAGLAEAAGR